ncbi:MAG: DNA ligase [Planctomycetota bacterium]|nr:MAG: DNA ligase [Planctomycetota bacterium]
MSAPSKLVTEHAALCEQIAAHDEAYYQRDAPTISDAEYDALLRRLFDIEAAHPELASETSPTQRVAGAPLGQLESVAHRKPMLSLANTYSREEVVDWFDSTRDFLAADDAALAFRIEPKLDGVAIELVYEHGRFVRAITRGDGKVGDDVTHNARTIRGVPRTLHTESPPALLEVRGEVVMRHASFATVNARREAAGEPLFVNPRNLASGTLKLLDPREAARRPLDFLGYGLGVTDGFEAEGHTQAMEQLEAWGLPTTAEWGLTGDLEAVLAHYDALLSGRDDLPFDVDGSVIKVNDHALQKRLGERSRSPRWAIAFKFPARSATSMLREIQVQVGRTGALTPRAVIEPVHVGGVTIEHVTLHNGDEIARLGVKPGDRVFVERAGDVIPKIVGLAEDGGGPPFVMPTACPVCATPVVDDEDEVVLRCPNRACPAVLQRRLEHFVSRNALDVDGLGTKVLALLVEQGLLTSLADLFALEAEQLAELPRMGEISARNAIEALQASRTRNFARFLFALGIRHVGQHVAEVIAGRWPDLAALRGVSTEDLEDVAEIGPTVAASLSAWLADDDEQRMVDRMFELGVAPQALAPPAEDDGAGVLAGLNVLFTGALQTLSRREAQELTKAHGGKLLSGVSKNLDLLVVGEKPGSKLKKAQELGIEVLEEAAFLERLGEAPR